MNHLQNGILMGLKIKFLVLIFLFYYAISMELPDKKIVEIKKWEDVRPFAGKVVAFITINDLYL